MFSSSDRQHSSSLRVIRSGIATVLAAAALVSIAVLAATPAQAGSRGPVTDSGQPRPGEMVDGKADAGWVYFNFDLDGYYEAAAMDTDGNGRYNVIWYDLDNDTRYDTHTWDSEDSHPALDHIHFDMNENGNPDVWVDFALPHIYGPYDYVCWNTAPEDGQWDRCEMHGYATLGAPNYNGVGNLMNTMARIHGTVV